MIIFLVGLLVACKIFKFKIKIEPRPIMKLPNIAEIVPNRYSEPTIPEDALELLKTTETVVQICAWILANLIIQGGGARGSKKVMRKI